MTRTGSQRAKVRSSTAPEQAASATDADTVLQAMTDAIVVVDANVQIQFVNASAERLFGYSPTQARGLALDALLPEWVADHDHDDDGAGIELGQPRNAISGSLRTGAVLLARARHRSGSEVEIELNVSATLPNEAGLVLVMREHNPTVDRGAHTHLEGATVGIVRLNGRGEITYMNEAWRSFVEENRAYESTCVGLGTNYLKACEDSPHAWGREVAAGIRALLAGERDFFEAVYSCHSPTSLRWLRVQGQRPPDEARSVVLTHIDGTAQQLALANSRIQACVTHTFASRTSLLASCRELALIVCHELEWDFMAVWVPDASAWELRCADVWTRPALGLQELEDKKRQTCFAPGCGLPGRVWSTRTAESLAAESTHRLLAATPLGESGFLSSFAFAVKYDDDVLAVIEIAGRICQRPEQSLLSLLEVAGVQLATAELRERAELRANAAQQEADAAREQLEALLACVPALVIAIDRSGTVRFVNQPMSEAPPPKALAVRWPAFFPDVARKPLEHALQVVLAGGPSQTHDVTVPTPDGGTAWYTNYLGPIRSGSQVTGALIVSQDVTQVKRAQEELFSAQRMAALGNMAAGVAHEINTPIQFLGDSIDFLREASNDTSTLLGCLLELRGAIEHDHGPAEIQALVQASHVAEEHADLEYLVEHVSKAFDRCSDGLNRVTTIVRSMKEFSHPAHKEMAPVDLNRAIMATLTVARNEYKYVADLVTDLEELPLVNCHINDVNQVVLNIVVNAAHAIGDVVGDSERRGTITVRTRVQGDYAVITIADTGGGIPVEIRERIFDPFFTTKEVGKGTGQGLALAWRAIKEKHAGELTFETKLGVGTTFIIKLPIEGKASGVTV